MVIINRLSCKGFKSFANKTELLFGNGFNCIIGPNGSGKSNIMDSLCFVLGKSSAKEMRAEKSSNLIFNGGKKHTPSKEAEVSIEFDNSAKEFPVNSKEVKITRLVKHSGNSVYKINDDVVTRQQVIDLLNNAKINPDGHNIVLQGDIINFISMKPVDRREILEEISGISIYEDKKQKCMNELAKVDSKLNEAEIILTEREVNLRELKKDRDHALKYRELEDEIRDNKATYLHLNIKEKNDNVLEIESKKKETEQKIEKTNNEISAIREKITSLKLDIKNINDEVETKGEKDQLILRKEIEELRTNIIKLNSRLEVCNNELLKINSRKDQLSNNIKDIGSKIIDLNKEKSKYEKDFQQINVKEKEAYNKLSELKKKYSFSAGSSLEDIDKKVEESISEINKLNESKQNLIRTKDQLIFKLSSLEEKLNNVKGFDLDSLKERKKLFKEVTERLNKFINQDSSYAAQLSTARHDFNNVYEELAKSRARQIGIQERSSSDLAVRKTLELSKSINGIYGTVSSLGKVDSKFALSLEVSAGQRVQSIVVESDLIAQKCIQNLKDNKLGIATFLPLNKIKARPIESDVKQLLKQKGVIGLALDLVKYELKYKDVFSYILGSTIIIDNIETGRKIGIGRARMVSIDGDLLETSGAMVGGYRIKRTGMGFMEKEIDESVLKLDQKYTELRKLIEHIENKKIENEVMINDLRKNKADIESEIIKVEKSFGFGVDMSSLLDEKKKITEENKELDNQLKSLEMKLKELQELHEKIKFQRNDIKSKLNNPEAIKSIEKIENEKMGLKETSLVIGGNIKNIETQIMTILMPEMEKTKQIIKQHDKEFSEFSEEIKNLGSILNERNNELKTKEDHEKKFHSGLKDLIEKRNKVTEKVQSFDNNIIREGEKLKQFEQKLNNISIDRAKLIAELEALQKEFEQYSNAKIKRGASIDELKSRINEYQKEMTKIGNVNLRALEVYDSIHEEYNKVSDKVVKIKSEKEDVLNMLNEVETKKKDIFMKTYKAITKNFVEIYNNIATKGEAIVNLENEENPFEGGVEIKIKIAGNKYLDMKSLSGGEKTLTALAFIFAIQEHSPSPFYLLDEVDAALDKKNSELLSKHIAKYSSKAQYIVISHNDHVITEANNIYGVSMQDGITKVISLKV